MNNLPSFKKDKAFINRTKVVIIGLPIVVAAVWFDTPLPWFTLLAVGWGMGAANEFFSIVKHSKGLSPLKYFGLLWVMLLIISPHINQIPHMADIQPESLLITTGIIIPLIILLWRKGKENAFANWAWTMAGILYIGWLLSFFISLRLMNDGRGWVFLAILSTFASDIGAYLTGKTMGKHKLAPYVSPNKTWEGAAGAVAASVIVSVVVIWLFHLPVIWWQAVILGALISVIGQLGDLVKSLFKRNMTVKDSGNILPGHGGFLDRMDSLLFTGVAVYYFAIFIMPVLQ